jgi:gliding motility-associated-like protein
MFMKNLLFIISLIFLSLHLSLSGQNFDAQPKTGCDTLTVKFNCISPVPVTSARWTFGDSAVSTEVNPQHKYLMPGRYLVTLVINNADSIAKYNFVQVGKTPHADFLYQDTLETGSRNIAFNAVKQADAPLPYSYSWKLSDGGVGNTANFVHQFDTTGNYTANLIIADVLGCADTISKALIVKDVLDIPNVFTPNDDNFNDLFIIQGNGVTTYSLSIFSRSGVKVFETAAKVLVWDGRIFSGEKARDGIYYYVVESVDGSTKIKQTGFVYLFGNPR